MDESRDNHVKWSQSEREITYMQSKKKGTNKLTCQTDPQTEKTN